jgi:hypothetical protein
MKMERKTNNGQQYTTEKTKLSDTNPTKNNGEAENEAEFQFPSC